MASTNDQPTGKSANVAALERLFIEWSKTGGRVPSWEFLAAHGCLAVDSLTEEQLGRLGVAWEVEQHLEALRDRLGSVGFVTRKDTTERAGEANENPAPTEVDAGPELPEWARRDSNARPLAPKPPGASDGQRPSA
jgi:hypothetical protein